VVANWSAWWAPNGAGKTSLLRVCLGLLLPRAGSVQIGGKSIGEIPRQDLARTVAYLPQAAISHWPLEVKRLVALGRVPHLAPLQRLSDDDVDAVEEALDLADVRHLVGRNVHELSGGERARVLLARALAVQAHFLLADEPVAGLDPGHQLEMMAIFREQAHAGTGVIVTLHDLSLTAQYCDRVMVLCDGFIVADGPPDKVLEPGILASVFRIRSKTGDVEGRRYIVPLDVVRSESHHAAET
jgi:iron complex transport system ATP-binding protein